MAADGDKTHARDPERFLPRAAEQARRVMGEMERYRQDLERPSRLVDDDVRAEGRAVVDGVTEALRGLLEVLETRPTEGRPKDE
ncbi:MAG TPA: hypothetical protein VFB66_25495 [Tepidisphaeraceae bacterium]|nr:hypothetical protein [Tepidisphaeraceae bacterium]